MGVKERLKRLEDKDPDPEGRTEISVNVLPPRGTPGYEAERKALAKKLRADRAAGVKIVSVKVIPPEGYSLRKQKNTT